MKKIITAAIALVLAGCHTALGPESGSPGDAAVYTIPYSAGGPAISQVLGWQWVKEDSGFI